MSIIHIPSLHGDGMAIGKGEGEEKTKEVLVTYFVF
jgi:hypothetical protein